MFRTIITTSIGAVVGAEVCRDSDRSSVPLGKKVPRTGAVEAPMDSEELL